MNNPPLFFFFEAEKMALKCKKCSSEDIINAVITEDTIGEIVAVEHRCRQCENRCVFNLNKDEEEETRRCSEYFEVV